MDARHAAAGPAVTQAKTDRNDAAGTASLVRTGRFPQMHVRTACGRVVRTEPAAWALLAQTRCDLENQIRGVLQTYGLVIGKAPRRLVKPADEIVAEQPVAGPELAGQVESLLTMRASMAERIAAIDPGPGEVHGRPPSAQHRPRSWAHHCARRPVEHRRPSTARATSAPRSA